MAGEAWVPVGVRRSVICPPYCEGGTTVKIPLIEREPDLTTGDSKNFLLSYYP